VAEAGAVALAPPLHVADAPVFEGAEVRDGPSPVAVGAPLGEGGAETDPPSVAEAALEGLLPAGGEGLAEGHPLGEPTAEEGDAAGEGERAPLPVAPRASREYVATGERLPASPEGVACAEGDAPLLWVAVARKELLSRVEGELGAEAVGVAGAGDAEVRGEGETEPVPPSERLPSGEREGEGGDEGVLDAPGERVGAAPEGDCPGEAEARAVSAPVNEGAPEPLGVRVGARTVGELEKHVVVVAVAARGDAEGLPDTEGLPDGVREGGAVPEGGREGAAEGEGGPLRLTEGETPALREGEGCGEALPDGAPVREKDGNALEERDALALGVSPPRAGEGVTERLAAEPEGDVAAERVGVREIDALPLGGPLGEAPEDWEGDPVAEREGSGVREALPLRSGDGVSPVVEAVGAVEGGLEGVPLVGDAVCASEGGLEGEPRSLAEPPALLRDARALSDAAADALGGGDSEAEPLALPGALMLAAAGEGVGAPGEEEGLVEGLCAVVAVPPPTEEGLAAAEGDAPPLSLREAAKVGVGA
jgi:hypothetical protein